jgi:hypothetical protein
MFCQNFVLKFYFVKYYFNPLNTFMGKGKDPDPVAKKDADPADPDPQHW